MADNKNKNINNTDVELEDDGSLFYDNTAGTIFSADSDAETGSIKSAKQSDKKKQKQEKTILVWVVFLALSLQLFLLHHSSVVL